MSGISSSDGSINRPSKQRCTNMSGDSSQGSCTICMDVKPDEEMFRSNSCTHTFCTPCITKYVKEHSHQNMRSMPVCPEFGCESILELQTCCEFTPEEDIASLVCKDLINQIHQHYLVHAQLTTKFVYSSLTEASDAEKYRHAAGDAAKRAGKMVKVLEARAEAAKQELFERKKALEARQAEIKKAEAAKQELLEQKKALEARLEIREKAMEEACLHYAELLKRIANEYYGRGWGGALRDAGIGKNSELWDQERVPWPEPNLPKPNLKALFFGDESDDEGSCVTN